MVYVPNWFTVDLKTGVSVGMYSDDSFIRTRLSPVDISGLTSLPDYWIAH